MGWIVFLLVVGGIAWAVWSINKDKVRDELAMPSAPDPATPEDLRREKARRDEDPSDNEERYQQHLAYLISRTKSRGGTRYFNQYVNRCREEAAAMFPKGAAAARRRNGAAGGVIAALGVLLSFFG